MPPAAEAYVHRIGRTGRAGREGTAITLAEPREHRLLRTIERFTKQKIEIATVPTVADLRARRLEVTRASLRERLLAGDFDDVRVVVESLAQEFDIVDIASAAVKMAHTGPRNPVRTRAKSSRRRRSPARGPSERRQAERGSRGPSTASTRMFVGVGRQGGVGPGDLVGAITGEAGVSSRDIGAIEITDMFALVEVPEDLADTIIDALRATTIKGHKPKVRREREDGSRHAPAARSSR